MVQLHNRGVATEAVGLGVRHICDGIDDLTERPIGPSHPLPGQIAKALQLSQAGADSVSPLPARMCKVSHRNAPAIAMRRYQTEETFGFEADSTVTKERIGDLGEVILSHHATPHTHAIALQRIPLPEC
ncbi:hypothetical protein [Streptomyces lunaelactis]|uniref:hypothetical protein n=1 Tax=Streptomyces lunaelactis TaxID=1535768 RepID=UPI00131F2BA9|nr:hypothetical protein [Streptomyces lunaelactis]NUK27824.1 hypothetical protein [Streptomyces lunaelactis]NUK89610.1 hypothetical protein [Streptomyces lunaelactis]